MTTPLFDLYAVSQEEIENWLDQIPNLSKLPSRREAYARQYDIAGKIRAAKSVHNLPEQHSANPQQSESANDADTAHKVFPDAPQHEQADGKKIAF